MVTSILLSSALFFISVFGPGLAAMRYFEWDKKEKLVGAIGVSLIFNYLATFGIYIAHLPLWTHFILALVNVGFFATHYKTFRFLLQDSQVVKILYGYIFIICWISFSNGLILNFSGGWWRGDWYEHYHRSLFFLESLPIDTLFLNTYGLPARPPLMNLLAGHYMAISGSEFIIFQHIFTLLNTLIFFPVYLLASKLFSNNKNVILPVIILLMFNPLFVQNSTYTWTKLFAGFFVLYAVYLYIVSWQSGDKTSFTMAWAMMAAGILTHYSAVPYALFLSLHYMTYVFWKRQSRLKELLVNTFIGTIILLTWFAWSVKAYGLNTTMLSNTVVTDSQGLGFLEVGIRILSNIYYSLVPHFMSGTGNWIFRMQDFPGYPRDFMFLLYQTNLYFAFGSMGLIIIGYIAAAKFAGKKYLGERELFWLSFVAFNIVLGIAVHGTLDPYGVIHICLQPVILLGLAFIAGHFYSLPSIAKMVIMIGLAMDYILGIVLHLYVQNISPGDGAVVWGGLGKTVHYNWSMKGEAGTAFIADHLVDYHPMIWAVMIALSLVAFIQLGRTWKKPIE